MAQVVIGYEVPRAEPVIVAVDGQGPANSAAAAAAGEENDYNCGVPPNVSRSVKATRTISVLIIAIHTIVLFFGQTLWVQWIASLVAIGTGCVVLCQFHRCAYTTAVGLYTIGMIFDILSVLFWIMYAEALAEGMTDDDIDKDQAERTIRLFAIIPGLGAAFQLFGAIAASTAACSWQNSGAPDAVTIVELRATRKGATENLPEQVGRMAP